MLSLNYLPNNCILQITLKSYIGLLDICAPDRRNHINIWLGCSCRAKGCRCRSCYLSLMAVQTTAPLLKYVRCHAVAKHAVYFKGGSKANFFGVPDLSLGAPQVPLIVRETFGEILGPRRPTVSEPRPAQKLGVKYSFPPDYPRGANGAPNCSSHHPDSSHIGFDGSRTNSLAVAAQNAIAEIGCGCLN